MEEEEEFLPEHSRSMRLALAYCQNKMEQSVPVVWIEKDPLESALSLKEQREAALLHFWRNHNHTEGEGQPAANIPILDLADNEKSALEFIRQFQHGNLPCLLRGMDQTWFSWVCSQWRQNGTNNNGSTDTGTDHNASNSNNTNVNRKWFLQTLGAATEVPVRYQPTSPSSSLTFELDKDGRAEECQTKHMTMREWIIFLEEMDTQVQQSSRNNHNPGNSYYLKDWHLQSFLRNNNNTGNSNKHHGMDDPTMHNNQPCNASQQSHFLYQVPPHFQHDLLNAFLTQFTTSQNGNNDYMFTYWGPKGSRTSLHSDVMNSFSWSFNVAGTKEWKFHPPPLPPSSLSSSPQEQHRKQQETGNSTAATVVVIQRAGECMFVPSGWQHEVTNLEETLSINHNWITTANLDQLWSGMCLEMTAIETELAAWNSINIDQDCMEARESMLQGCFGMDVTGFFFLLLTRLLELLLCSCEVTFIYNNQRKHTNDDAAWQRHFDLVTLKESLLFILNHSSAEQGHGNDETKLRLEARLEAVLGSRNSALLAVEIARCATEAVKYPSTT